MKTLNKEDAVVSKYKGCGRSIFLHALFFTIRLLSVSYHREAFLIDCEVPVRGMGEFLDRNRFLKSRN